MFIYTKKFPSYSEKIMQSEMPSEFPHPVLPLPCNVYRVHQCDITVTWSMHYWYKSGSGASACVHLSKQKVNTYPVV